MARHVAAGEPVEGVLPGVGTFHVPTLTGLDGRLLAFVRDAAVQAAFVEHSAGLVRVVAMSRCTVTSTGNGPRSSRRSRGGDTAAGLFGLQLDEFVLSSGKADFESFQLTEPAFAFALDDASQEVVGAFP